MQFGTFQPPQQTTTQTTTETTDINSPSNQQTPQPTQTQTTLVAAKKEEPKILMALVGQPVLGRGFKVDNGISYQRLVLKEIEKKYLFLDLKMAEKDKWQQVSVTITQDGTQMIIANCIYDTQDTCYISGDRLKAAEILFLTIRCQDDCTYNLNSRWSDIEHLKPGDRSVFKFGQENFQLYHVELGNTKFEEFRVHVSPRTTQRPFENVKIYGKYGQNDPTPEDYDFKSVNLWEDGEGLFVTYKQMEEKGVKDKNMNLLLVGQSDTSYQLSCDLITE